MNHITPMRHSQRFRPNYKSVIRRAPLRWPAGRQPTRAVALMKKWSLIFLVTGDVSRQ
jgi:hypothetical protein